MTNSDLVLFIFATGTLGLEPEDPCPLTLRFFEVYDPLVPLVGVGPSFAKARFIGLKSLISSVTFDISRFDSLSSSLTSS